MVLIYWFFFLPMYVSNAVIVVIVVVVRVSFGFGYLFSDWCEGGGGGL